MRQHKIRLVAMLLLVLISVAAHSEPLIVAHRGASWDAPENTLAAVNLAWKQGMKAVEVDIMLSKDGHVVVFHDKTTKRFNGKKDKVSDLTLAQLKMIDVGSHKEAKWKKERIPSLEEVLKTVPADGIIVIELKAGPELLKPLQDAIRKSGLRDDQILIIGFDRKLVKQTRQMFPKIQIHRLLRLPTLSGRIAAKRVRQAGIDTISIRHGKGISKKLVNHVQSVGMKVFVWTVNCPQDAIKLQEAGVNGIITDRPALVMEELARARKNAQRQQFDRIHQPR